MDFTNGRREMREKGRPRSRWTNTQPAGSAVALGHVESFLPFFPPLFYLSVKIKSEAAGGGRIPADLIFTREESESRVLMQPADKRVSNPAQPRTASVLYSSLFLPPVMVI